MSFIPVCVVPFTTRMLPLWAKRSSPRLSPTLRSHF